MPKKIKDMWKNVAEKIRDAKTFAQSRSGASNSKLFRDDFTAAVMALAIITMGGFIGGVVAALIMQWLS